MSDEAMERAWAEYRSAHRGGTMQIQTFMRMDFAAGWRAAIAAMRVAMGGPVLSDPPQMRVLHNGDDITDKVR